MGLLSYFGQCWLLAYSLWFAVECAVNTVYVIRRAMR